MTKRASYRLHYTYGAMDGLQYKVAVGDKDGYKTPEDAYQAAIANLAPFVLEHRPNGIEPSVSFRGQNIYLDWGQMTKWLRDYSTELAFVFNRLKKTAKGSIPKPF